MLTSHKPWRAGCRKLGGAVNFWRLEVNIGQISPGGVVTVDENESALAAAERMRDCEVGSLVVTRQTNDGRCVVGIVTDRDLLLKVLATGMALPDVVVARVVSPRLVAASSHATPGDTAELGDDTQAMSNGRAGEQAALAALEAAVDEQARLPGEALGARWRQVTAP
jgi:hypothetical protein